MPDRHLVLISGPVAAGKSSTVIRLAELARAQGRLAAAIDMDETIEMVAGSNWSTVQKSDRIRACRATASFVHSLFESGMELVAIAGSTLSPYEWDALAVQTDPPPKILYVLLRVSIEESVRRAQADPGRIHTRDPEYVTRLAAAIDWESIRQPDLVVQTDGMSLDEVTEAIASNLTPPLRRWGGGRGEGS